jgi:hypothetical protein
MFNLFPKEKSVDEILRDAGLPKMPDIWELVQIPSCVKAQQEVIDELLKEIKSLRHLKQENADLLELLAKYKNGYQGSCYACEPVGELNQKLELRLVAYQKMVEGAYETIEDLKKKNVELCGKYDEAKRANYPHHWGGYTDETSWETASGDLALRVVKLERQVEELKLINSQIHINRKP